MLDKSEYKVEKIDYNKYSVITFYEPVSNGLLFSLSYFELEYWNQEVKDNFPMMYTEIYKSDKNLLICISASDVQYDEGNIQEKERYQRLWNTMKKICSSAYIFTD